MLFADLIGQEKIKEKLIKTVGENHVSHAQLFLGPEGSGNMAAALAFSRYLFCKNRSASDSCASCPSCVKMDKLAHPDLHFSFPIILSKEVTTSDSQRKEFTEALIKNPYLTYASWLDHVEGQNKQPIIAKAESDEIVKKLSLKSFEGGYKIMIIWLPEFMNAVAANKLLKTIEEPPAKTLIIMVANDQDKLLGTIISRTQLTRFGRLSDSEIEDGLLKNGVINPSIAQSIARIAEGNFFDALQLAQHQGEENLNFITFRDWMRLCYKKNMPAAVDFSETISPWPRENQKSFIKYGLHILRQCILSNYSGKSLIRVVETEEDFTEKFGPFITGNNIVPLNDAFNTAYYHLERNANSKILFLDLSFQVMKLLNSGQ